MKEKGKWVTKTNMVLWIVLGLCLVMFGICMGIWKDVKMKTIEKMTSPETMMIDILTETYSSEQKLQSISQIDRLQEEYYANYRVILQDKKMTADAKIDQLKRKIVYLYYIPNYSLDAHSKIQKIKTLDLSKDTSADIVDILTDGLNTRIPGGGKKNADQKLDSIQDALKKDI